jgi:hypothetical protein
MTISARRKKGEAQEYLAFFFTVSVAMRALLL